MIAGLHTKLRRLPALIALDEPFRQKAELLTVDWLLPLRYRLRAEDMRAGAAWFGADSFKIDRIAYFGIHFGWYETDYADATVIDIGAHKGYFAVYALRHGARTVISCEPESRNFALLERTARQFRGPGAWRLVDAAVTDYGGEATLCINAESASHSLLPESGTEMRPTVGQQRVRTVTLSSLLEGIEGRVVVKLDAEGAECPIVCRSPLTLWQRVDEAFIEWHALASCTADDLVDHLGQAGLHVARRDRDADTELLRFTR